MEETVDPLYGHAGDSDSRDPQTQLKRAEEKSSREDESSVPKVASERATGRGTTEKKVLPGVPLPGIIQALDEQITWNSA